ncbi:hypothetical protein V9T40_000313 [Parthenolecanium corni]|uniref:Uncharacterized protein n=1 Tax=Parthenolecanium corni TaxID=536013 RepID=A0AAN9TCP5_9HEMI
MKTLILISNRTPQPIFEELRSLQKPSSHRLEGTHIFQSRRNDRPNERESISVFTEDSAAAAAADKKAVNWFHRSSQINPSKNGVSSVR